MEYPIWICSSGVQDDSSNWSEFLHSDLALGHAPGRDAQVTQHI